MKKKGLPFSNSLPGKVEVDVAMVSSFTRESEFASLAVELLKETAIVTSLLACTYPLDQDNNQRRWTRNEAVLAGLMVRLSKLQSGFLDQVCQHRREIADIIFRPLIENIVNITYLLTQDRAELIEEYIEYSLRTEKRFLMEIENNIREQGFELPIETRMKASVMSVFEKSGISPEQVNDKNKQTWGGSVRNRAKLADMEDGYLSLIGLPSHAVHGNWQDLITHHLGYENGEFYPEIGWTRYRPQGLFAVALFSAHVNLLYTSNVISQTQKAEEIEKLLADLIARIGVANELHEQFLQKEGS